jgi:hypothetical protein
LYLEGGEDSPVGVFQVVDLRLSRQQEWFVFLEVIRQPVAVSRAHNPLPDFICPLMLGSYASSSSNALGQSATGRLPLSSEENRPM